MFARSQLSITDGSKGSATGLPAPFAAMFRGQAAPGESAIAWLELDLDADLHFAQGMVVLTERRLIAFEPVNGKPRSAPAETWPRYATTAWTAAEQGGVGALELFAGDKRLGRW